MKNIIRGKDDLVYRIEVDGPNETEYLLSDFDSVEVEIYTTNADSFVTLDSQYIDTANNFLRVPSDCLDSSKLPDGKIRLRLYLGLSDTVFPDNVNNQSAEIETCYFLTSLNDNENDIND